MDQHPDRLCAEPNTLYLPIEWQAASLAKETRIAVETWLEAVLAYSGPVSLAFHLSVSKHGASGGMIISGVDHTSTREAATLIRTTAHALNAWQGLGEPVPWSEPEVPDNSFDLVRVEGPGRKIFNHRAAPWAVAATLEHPTNLRIDLLGNDTDGTELEVRCTVRVSGSGPAAEMIATLVAADPPGSVRLQAAPRLAASDSPPEITLPLTMVAHLVAAPARMPGAWPTQPVKQPAELTALLDDAIPPHAAIFGGSGLGKTTFLEHLVSRSLADGNTAIVICPHGDLAVRAASVAAQADADFTVIDFGSELSCPRWNLSIPPPGVSATQWASELVGIVRNVWADAPDEWFGPVWVQSMRVIMSVLTRDPRGPQPLTEFTNVATSPILRSTDMALLRIGDEILGRELRRLLEGIEKDPNSHWGIWLTSKMEPLTADDRIRAVIGSEHSTIDLTRVTQGESLIVAAPASALGDEGATLLVGTMITQLWHELRKRRDRRQVVDVFADEVHRVPHQTMLEMLTEGRKFGVRLRVATQSPKQLRGPMRDAVLANTGVVATFRTGPSEAALLDPLYATTPASTIVRLDRHWIAMTNGSEDLVGPTAAPLVDPDDHTAFDTAHVMAHGPTRAEMLAQLGRSMASLRTAQLRRTRTVTDALCRLRVTDDQPVF